MSVGSHGPRIDPLIAQAPPEAWQRLSGGPRAKGERLYVSCVIKGAVGRRSGGFRQRILLNCMDGQRCRQRGGVRLHQLARRPRVRFAERPVGPVGQRSVGAGRSDGVLARRQQQDHTLSASTRLSVNPPPVASRSNTPTRLVSSPSSPSPNRSGANRSRTYASRSMRDTAVHHPPAQPDAAELSPPSPDVRPRHATRPGDAPPLTIAFPPSYRVFCGSCLISKARGFARSSWRRATPIPSSCPNRTSGPLTPPSTSWTRPAPPCRCSATFPPGTRSCMRPTPSDWRSSPIRMSIVTGKDLLAFDLEDITDYARARRDKGRTVTALPLAYDILHSVGGLKDSPPTPSVHMAHGHGTAAPLGERCSRAGGPAGSARSAGCAGAAGESGPTPRRPSGWSSSGPSGCRPAAARQLRTTGSPNSS